MVNCSDERRHFDAVSKLLEALSGQILTSSNDLKVWGHKTHLCVLPSHDLNRLFEHSFHRGRGFDSLILHFKKTLVFNTPQIT